MYGFGSGLVWVNDMNCIGWESSLFECRNVFCLGGMCCYYSSDVGVVCIGLKSGLF